MVYATAEGAGQMRRLRYGMIGGGRDAFIGAVHRMAARLDDQYELVAGALSADPEKARLSGRDLGLDPTRIYGGFAEMAKAEAARPDGIEAAASKGARFITDHILEVTDRTFDDFAATGVDKATNLKLLGLDR